MTDVLELKNLLDRYTGEYTDERIPDEDRLSALSESVSTIKQRMKGDMSNATFPVSFIPDIFYYKIDRATYNVLAAGNIRVTGNDHTGAKYSVPFERSSADKINEDTTKGFFNNTYALDRYDKELYLVINHNPMSNKTGVPLFNEITDVVGSGDVGLIAVDNNETIDGNAIRFTLDSSLLTTSSISVPIAANIKLDYIQETGALVYSFWVDDATDLTSVSFKIKTDNSNYRLFTALAPFNFSSFKEGWNRVVVEWKDSIEGGTFDPSTISGYEFILNYGDDFTPNTVRLDAIYFANPTRLNFHYLSYSVGNDVSGAEIHKFSEDDDIPYFAGQYENLKYAVARLAASYILSDLRRYDDALMQEREADKRIKEVMNLIPSQHTAETKSFRPHGVNMRLRRTLKRYRR